MLHIGGFYEFNIKLAIVPFAFSPISTSAQFTHPVALAHGEEMTGVISAGYDYNIGDVQVSYCIN